MAREVAGADRFGGDPELALAARDQVDDGGGVARIGEGDVDARVGDPERAHQRRHRVDRQGGERARGRGARPSSPATASTAARPVSTSRSTWRAGSTRASPAGVSTTRRPTRWKRGVPSSASSSRIACDTEGCDDELGLGGAGHPPVVDHGEEQAELPEIHRYSL